MLVLAAPQKFNTFNTFDLLPSAIAPSSPPLQDGK
jgi:hypothetical protein